MARKNCIAIAAALALLWGCKNPDTKPVGPVAPAATGDVLVVCEGSLGNGNSALTKIPADSAQAASEDVFYAINGQQLGDIFQSISYTGKELALCINNSDRIYFINPSDYRLQHTISVAKPRYLVPTGGDRAYVSSLFSNRVFVLDLNAHAITDTLFFPYKNPEGMLLHDGLLYVAAWDTANAFLYRINPVQKRVADSIYLGRRAPQTILADKAQNLWIVSGNDPQGVRPALTCLNPKSGAILAQYDFPAGKEVMKPCLNPTRDTLYWLSVDYYGGAGQSGVFRMPITATALPQTPFVAAENLQYFWALGIQPGTGNIFIGDPKGFTQRGEALMYNPAGALLKRWKTGVGPGAFYFL